MARQRPVGFSSITACPASGIDATWHRFAVAAKRAAAAGLITEDI
jgi:hypothetical protein